MNNVGSLLLGWAMLQASTGCSSSTVISSDLPDGGPSELVVIRLPDAQSPETLPTLGCSRDLHSVVDDAGTIVATCAPDQGCFGGSCVPACQAVAATHGSVGCDFLIARPPLAAYPTSCFAAFVANDWNRAVAIRIARGTTEYDTRQFGRVAAAGASESTWEAVSSAGLSTGQVAVLFLEGGPGQVRGCPVAAAVETSTSIDGTGRGQAWHIVTDTPVSVYDIVPYGGADSVIPSAELVFPTTTFGKNYVAVVPMARLTNRRISIPPSQWAQIVAAEDGTEVKIVPKAALPAGSGVAAAPEKVVATYSLSAGEVIQWARGDGREMEITGSIVSSNRPIGFIGGNEYLCIDSSTSTVGGCDSAHQQIPPVDALGNRYVVAPHPSRRMDGQYESSWYRIVGAVNETALTFDPPVPGAPTALGQGQWFNFEAVGAFELTSQDSDHPFYLAQTMSGAGVTSAKPGNLGDEEFVNVVPTDQFVASYVFYTDATYTTTMLMLTQCDGGRGLRDVKVACSGVVRNWMPVGSNGKCRWAAVTLVEDGKSVETCKNGPQDASSDEPFGLTVWGLASYASYAYPAGAGIAPINRVVIPPVPIP